MNRALITLFLGLGICACGVKGRPLPPQEPAFIGTGAPAYLNKKDEKKNNQKR